MLPEWMLRFGPSLIELIRDYRKGSIHQLFFVVVVVLVEVVGVDYLLMMSSNFSSSQSQSPPPLELVCRMGFLILEGMLTLYPTRIHGRTTAVAAAINNNQAEGQQQQQLVQLQQQQSPPEIGDYCDVLSILLPYHTLQ